MARRTLLALLLVAGLAAAAVTAASGRGSKERTVPCDEVIDHTAFPYLGSPGARYRLVLGVVSLPAYMGELVPMPGSYWRYGRKQGLVVRANGAPVTITVPRSWRTRVAIAWGYGNKGGPFSSVRIAGCGADPEVGNVYSGGFSLRVRAACVPLVFRAGKRTATVRFGLGRRCPERAPGRHSEQGSSEAPVATSQTWPSGSAKEPLYPPQGVCAGAFVSSAPASFASARTSSTRASERTLYESVTPRKPLPSAGTPAPAASSSHGYSVSADEPSPRLKQAHSPCSCRTGQPSPSA